MELRVAMGQMAVEGGEPEANLRRAEGMIAQAAERGCSFVVLPECLDVGWTHPDAARLAEPIPGPRCQRLADAARAANIHVVAGLTERDGRDVYNTAVLIAPDGELLLKHRKINVLAIAQDLYSIGDSLGVARTSHGVVGIDICADNFATSLAFGHSLCRMGARMILSPSAWAVDGDHDNEREPYGDTWVRGYTPLAELYDVTVIGVSNVGWITGGPWEGRKCIGCSLAIGPGGKVLARGPYGEEAQELIVVPVETTPQEATGTEIVDMLRQRGYEGP